MMTHDVVIIGTGPAGVSAAWPLVQSGRDVLMVDASIDAAVAPPEGEYFDLRRNDPNQRDWMFGADLASWIDGAATSPKLRVPTLRSVFEGFGDANRIETENFAAIGSLASGGLSNAWGCGVARYDSAEMAEFPLAHADLNASFAAVSRRIGLSGKSDDDLSGYFGLDDWADPAPALDDKATRFFRLYSAGRSRKVLQGFRLGRSRLALLSSDREGRRACSMSGLCLWGCRRGALYSAAQELPAIARSGAALRGGIIVSHLEKIASGWRICGADRHTGSLVTIDARHVVLAAGTLATTAIAWRTLKLYQTPGRVHSNPTAAFLLLFPASFGRSIQNGPAFGQLAFTLGMAGYGQPAYGALFSPMHFPTIDFVRHIPFSRTTARKIWRVVGPATLVGNVFLPSELNDHTAELTTEGSLQIRGNQKREIADAVSSVSENWKKIARTLGAVVMPGSFKVGLPGSDIHYAGTLPMRENPRLGETDSNGELAQAPGIFVADAATFPVLSPKPHTLTMMALADRLGRHLAALDR